jgi:glycosyltransferase involved in cell wall biosynthesis
MTRPPIALFVYNRTAHTMLTIEALQKNHGALESTLYIFSDGPRSDAEVEGVAAVRNYVKKVAGFADVILVERERNLGLSRSLISGINEVLDSNDSIIVLEDDLVTSPYFLQFMCEALRCYEHEEQVVAVHGYTFPLGIKFPETFFLCYTGCWGWGTWRRTWALFEPNGRKLLEQLQNLHLTTSFDMNGAYPYTQMLKDQVNGKVDSWAIRWYASTFLSDKLNLYPGVSLVKNIGHDGSGEHSFNSPFYDVDLANKRIEVFNITVCEDKCVAKCLEAYFRNGNPGIIRYLIRKLFGKNNE